MDILSNINVQGDISFSGNIIGNIPGASISTEAYNSIKKILMGYILHLVMKIFLLIKLMIMVH